MESFTASKNFYLAAKFVFSNFRIRKYVSFDRFAHNIIENYEIILQEFRGGRGQVSEEKKT